LPEIVNLGAQIKIILLIFNTVNPPNANKKKYIINPSAADKTVNCTTGFKPVQTRPKMAVLRLCGCRKLGYGSKSNKISLSIGRF